MLKIIKSNLTRIIKMEDMEPLQIARVIEEGNHKGKIVMRTASLSKFEVMILSDSGIDRCWSTECPLMVELLIPSEKIIIELYNEE